MCISERWRLCVQGRLAEHDHRKQTGLRSVCNASALAIVSKSMSGHEAGLGESMQARLRQGRFRRLAESHASIVAESQT